MIELSKTFIYMFPRLLKPLYRVCILTVCQSWYIFCSYNYKEIAIELVNTKINSLCAISANEKAKRKSKARKSDDNSAETNKNDPIKYLHRLINYNSDDTFAKMVIVSNHKNEKYLSFLEDLNKKYEAKQDIFGLLSNLKSDDVPIFICNVINSILKYDSEGLSGNKEFKQEIIYFLLNMSCVNTFVNFIDDLSLSLDVMLVNLKLLYGQDNQNGLQDKLLSVFNDLKENFANVLKNASTRILNDKCSIDSIEKFIKDICISIKLTDAIKKRFVGNIDHNASIHDSTIIITKIMNNINLLQAHIDNIKQKELDSCCGDINNIEVRDITITQTIDNVLTENSGDEDDDDNDDDSEDE